MFPFPHLLGVAELERSHIETILKRADALADLNAARAPVERTLKDRTVINLFFEPSTRTQASFELAAKRLGATVMNMSLKTSSMTKGETLLDTAATLNAMLPDILVVRHSQSGAVKLLSEKVNCAVVNAGDGWCEHPTQALLDALTMLRGFRERRGPDSPAARLEGLTVAICGDVAHSRVARSNIFLHRALGNKVRVSGPPTLIPAGIESLGVERCADLESCVRGADVVMMLRLQNERMDGAFVPSMREYFHNFGLDDEALEGAAADALVMHPGPMNRGVEIDSRLADDPDRSVIATQVQMGVATRMAVLELLSANLPHQATRNDRDFGQPMSRRFIAAHAPLAQTPMTPGEPRGPDRAAFVNARLIDPETETESVGDLIIEDGEIREIGQGLAAGGFSEEIDVVDCGGAILAPGLVDMRVFIGEPGERHKESFGSGGEAAVAGGVTTIVTQPDTTPAVDDPALLEFIVQRVHDERADHAMPHVFPMAALTQGLAGKKMTEFEFLLEAGAVALSEGDHVVADSLVFRRCLAYAAALGALVCHMPKDPHLAGGACATEGAMATRLGLPAAPAAAEAIMLERDLALARLTGARYHAAQLSTAASVDGLRRAKAAGLDVSAAVSINHLVFSEEAIADYRTFFKLEPPLRVEEDRRALLQGVADGTIDCIVSSHRPQSEEDKRLPYAEAATGAVGLETLLSTALGLAAEGAAPLARLWRALSYNPAQRLGLPTGRLAQGAPADLVLIDPKARWRLNRHQLRSKSKNSPFDRAELTGVVLRTLVDGRTVYVAEPESAG